MAAPDKSPAASGGRKGTGKPTGKPAPLNLAELLTAPDPLDPATLAPVLEPLFHQAATRAVEQLTGSRVRPWVSLLSPRYPLQIDYHRCDAFIRGFVGGVGSGKSFSGAEDLMERAKADRTYMVIAPTYRLLADATMKTFLDSADKKGVLLKANKTDAFAVVQTKDGGSARINFRSASDPDKLRGPNCSGIWVDEASYVSEDAFLIALGRLREAGELGWIGLTFTPKGRGHWTYQRFFDKDGKPQQNTRLFRASTKDNPYLPPELYRILLSQYVEGSTLARQELGGEFVDLTGLLFQPAWFKIVNRAERIKAGGYVPDNDCPRVRYWDKAGTEGGGDYSCGVLLSRGEDGLFYVEHVARGQWSPHQRNMAMAFWARRDAAWFGNKVTIFVEQEPGSGGKESALLTLQQLAEFPVYIDKVTGDKVSRARPMQAQAEAGRVVVMDCPWTKAWLDEMASFPEGKHDDQVDATCGAYNKLAAMTGGDWGNTGGALVAWPEKPGENKEGSGLGGQGAGVVDDGLAGAGAGGTSGRGNRGGGGQAATQAEIEAWIAGESHGEPEGRAAGKAGGEATGVPDVAAPAPLVAHGEAGPAEPFTPATTASGPATDQQLPSLIEWLKGNAGGDLAADSGNGNGGSGSSENRIAGRICRVIPARKRTLAEKVAAAFGDE